MQLMKDENFSVSRLKALFLLNVSPPIVREAQPKPRGRDQDKDSATSVVNQPAPLPQVPRGQDQDQDRAKTSSTHPETAVASSDSESAFQGTSDMPNNAPVPSPIVPGEYNTPLTSNISDKSKVDSTPQQQYQLSSINLDVKLSPEVLHLQASPKLDPVNLEDNFKATTEAVPGKDQIFDSP